MDQDAPTALLDSDAIAQLMVGRELSRLYPAKQEPDVDEAVVLSVRGLSTGYVKDIGFELRKGEVLGFSGLIGSGRTEIMEAIVGLRPRLSGEVIVKGAPLPPNDLAEAARRGLAYMTKDRKGRGLLLGEGMIANLTLQSLARHVRHFYLDPASERQAMERAKRRFDIRVRDDRVRVGRMSGGNQQKLMLAKIMETAPEIVIIDEPTRGIDRRHQAADLSFHRRARPRRLLDHRRLVGNAGGDRPLHPRRGDARGPARRHARGRGNQRADHHALRRRAEAADGELTSTNAGKERWRRRDRRPPPGRRRVTMHVESGSATAKRQRIWRDIDLRAVAPFAALALLLIVGALVNPNFIGLNNLANVATRSAFIAIIAVGATFVISSGDLDLSVGSMVAFVASLMILFMNSGVIADPALMLLAAVVLAVVVGSLCGLANGLITTVGRIEPFIATLGTMGIYRGSRPGCPRAARSRCARPSSRRSTGRLISARSPAFRCRSW